ncbi:hypothetical protein MPER_10145, partial [Moniliophthora perniciosa FA553]
MKGEDKMEDKMEKSQKISVVNLCSPDAVALRELKMAAGESVVRVIPIPGKQFFCGLTEILDR